MLSWKLDMNKLFNVDTVQTHTRMVQQTEQSGWQFSESTNLEHIAHIQFRAQLNDCRFTRTRLIAKRPFHVEGDWYDVRIGRLFVHPLARKYLMDLFKDALNVIKNLKIYTTYDLN